MSSLNEKQLRFIFEYFLDFNLTKAAIRAGYAEKNAYAQALTLKKNPIVRKKMQEISEERNQELLIDANRMIEISKDILETEFYTNEMKAGELPEHLHKYVTGFKSTTRTFGRNNDCEETTYTFKFMSKDKAKATLDKYTGIAADKLELSFKPKTIEEIVEEAAKSGINTGELNVARDVTKRAKGNSQKTQH